MSQSGKILHLYVEVRSVADEERKTPVDVEKTESPMLTAPDILLNSQYGGTNVPHGQISPRGVLHKGGCSTPSLASSKSTSRHSVSFQLHPDHDADQPSTQHQKSLPYDEISQLLSVLQTGHSGSTYHLVCSPSERDPFFGREPQFSGRFTAPPTPSGTRKACNPSMILGTDEGRRSIATFSYIEKAKVKSVDSHYSILCHNEPQNPFKKTMEDRATSLQLRKRLSDPMSFNSLESMNNCSSKQLSQCLGNSHVGSPDFRRATLGVAREATSRALEEFGSPKLKQKLGGNHTEKGYNARRGEQHRCRSWSGSPIIPASSRTLPPKATLMDQEQNSSFYRLPRSPATDQLSNHAKQAYLTMSHSTANFHDCLNQKTQSRHRPTLPSCKPTAIQHDLPAMTVTQPPSNCMSESQHQPHKVNFNMAKSKTNAERGEAHQSGRTNLSPAASPEAARKLAEEAAKLSKIMEARRSPSPTPSSTEMIRSESPRLRLPRELQLHGTSQDSHFSSNSQVLEHNCKQGHVKNVQQSLQANHLLPHLGRTSTGAPSRLNLPDIKSSSAIRDLQKELVAKDSCHFSSLKVDKNAPNYEDREQDVLRCHIKEHNRKSFTKSDPESSADCTLQQKYGMEKSFFKDKERVQVFNNQKRNNSASCSLDNQPKLTAHQNETKVDRKAKNEANVAAAQSYCGIKASPLSDSLHEKDCTSSGTNQKTSDSGKTGIHPESGQGLQRGSVHSQKIARAKWEFLFGSHSEDHSKNKGSSTPPSNDSTSPTSSPLSTHQRPNTAQSRHCKSSSSLKPSYHDVKPDQVDFFNPSKTTSNIRHAVKYSETDIDAVPLRSYRETDLDEVMLAEQEEVDSAFGSNRSVLGTSDTSSISPMNGVLCPQTDGEEELQDEEVVSWASVRMQGDKKRQYATSDGDTVFCRLLRGPLDCQPDSHTALKSPITVTSPCRVSADALDSFSRHFESIMESHRAKGTSYSSLDSEDITPSGPPIFTFDFPTLTPEIQSQICESAKQITELNFPSLTSPELPAVTDLMEASQDKSSVYEDGS
ncbi:hypothetical protein DNTS_002654, partial [Danionella cerebrum]